MLYRTVFFLIIAAQIHKKVQESLYFRNSATSQFFLSHVFTSLFLSLSPSLLLCVCVCVCARVVLGFELRASRLPGKWFTLETLCQPMTQVLNNVISSFYHSFLIFLYWELNPRPQTCPHPFGFYFVFEIGSH
jgi:hypothetical protein